LAALVAVCVATFVAWMATSGNGRYFMPTLLLAGPLCIALLNALPISRGARVGAALFMLAAQGFLLHEVAPWHSWGLVEWRDPPAFAVDVPRDLVETPATYVTVNGISYSLIAPAFHPASRWMSVASQQGRPTHAQERQRVRDVIAQSGVVYVLFPSLPGQPITTHHLQPELARALDTALLPHGLRLPEQECRVLASRGLTSMGVRAGEPVPTAPELQRGFWLCKADKVAPVNLPPGGPVDPRIEAAFAHVEAQCPRMFPPGTATTVALSSGARRFYLESDMRLYVSESGQVMYKYIRAMNAVALGTIDEVLAPGFHLECNAIRGRGMPWDREI
jgi:hypothetical protein